MCRILILTLLFTVSCIKQPPAPQKWSDWVKVKKVSFSKKISTPAAIQFLYLKTESPDFYLSKNTKSYKISASKSQSGGTTAYKLNFEQESLLNANGDKIGDSSASIQIKSNQIKSMKVSI